MAFRRRQFRRRSFRRGPPVARKENIWISTAYADLIPTPPGLRSDMYQLVGPEDYTQDFLTDVQRRDSCSIVRIIVKLRVNPFAAIPGVASYNFKVALFTGGDEHVEDALVSDDSQFEILDPSNFVDFCREWDVLQYSSIQGGSIRINSDGFAEGDQALTSMYWSFDGNITRKLKTDTALWLLIAATSGQNPVAGDFVAEHDIESRVLIRD